MAAGVSSSERSAVAALLRSVDVLARMALALACIALLVLGVLPRTGWYRPVTVLSGSMKPTFAPGDMVIVTPEPVQAVRRGQIISYRIPIGDHHVQTHRVLGVVRHGARVAVRTKGDANATADPWTAELHGTTVWRVRGVLPKFGWVVFWLRGPLVHAMTVLLAPLLLALLAVVRIWRRADDVVLEDASPAT